MGPSNSKNDNPTITPDDIIKIIDEFQKNIKEEMRTKLTEQKKNQEKTGMVLNMSMGLGKTRTILSFLNEQENKLPLNPQTNVYVFVPFEAIKEGFQKDWGTVKDLPDTKIGIVPEYFEFKDFENFFEKITKTTDNTPKILVFDEVHLVQSKMGNIGVFLQRLRSMKGVKAV